MNASTKILVASALVCYFGCGQQLEQNNTNHDDQTAVSALQDQISILKQNIEEQRRESERAIAEITTKNATLKNELDESKTQLKRLNEGRDSLISPPSRLQVSLVKTYQVGDTAYIDFSATNKSDMFIRSGVITADVFNGAGQFLGHERKIFFNVRPGHTVTGKMLYSNVVAETIMAWKPKIETINIQQPDGGFKDRTFEFKLETTPEK